MASLRILPLLLLGSLTPATPAQSLGLPDLPKLKPTSRRDTILFADRVPLSAVPSAFGSQSTGATLLSGTLSAAETGTGMHELFQYQLPPGYDPIAPAIPLVVAWHGFGASANSVASQSTLDEECAARGWAFLSVTGIDDKLFGPPASQQNAEAVIAWMLSNFHVDPDRIYMVGFSMGAGVVGNFAARHRDPDGIMIAALGLVSGSFDWTATWNLEPGVHVWMGNPWNFGGPPGDDPFAFQRSSDLYFDPYTYPPLPGTLLPAQTMASNLHSTPTYLTWDLGDTIPYLPAESAELSTVLAGSGTDLSSLPVTGTADPGNGLPATHSWAVLDESDLLDFFTGRRVDRRPAQVQAQFDTDGTISYLGVTRAAPDAFAHVSADVDVGGATLSISGVVNALDVIVDLEDAGLVGVSPLTIHASSGEGSDHALHLRGVPGAAPSYVLDSGTGLLLAGVESDPDNQALIVPVPAGAGLHGSVVTVPWRTRLSVLPDPAAPGADVTIAIDGMMGAQGAWLIIGFSQSVTPLPWGLVMIVPPWPPAMAMPLPLDASGDASLSFTLPDNQALVGASFMMQAIIVGPGPGLSDVTNAFRFDVQ